MDVDDPIPALMAQLRDASKDVFGAYAPGRGEFAPRWQAVHHLVALGDRAVEPLCAALNDSNGYTRRFAAEALAKIGDSRAVPALVGALQTSDSYVQRYVANALGVLGDERAIIGLYAALQNPWVASEALRALHSTLQRAISKASTADLLLLDNLADTGRSLVEVPSTDDGYVTLIETENPLDYRPLKQLANDELQRRRG
jgi:HEAT repeat protein